TKVDRRIRIDSSYMGSVRYVVIWVHIFFFFFSSRRRHTRFSRDWSSDVCSSDLDKAVVQAAVHVAALDREARLSRVDEGAPNGTARNDVHINVIQNQHGIFAAQLEDNRKQACGSNLCDSLAAGNTSGKDQFVELRVGERGAGGAVSHHQLKDILGHACGME